MKKRLLFTGLFLILMLNCILAEDSFANPLGINPDNLEDTTTKIQDTTEKIQDTSYLKQEWTKMLERSQIGRILLKISDVLAIFDPAFKIILGIESSLNWLFVLTLLLWLVLLINLYKILSAFSTFSKWASLGITICLMAIISVLKIPLTISQTIINAVSLLTIWWVQLIIIFLIVIIAIIAIRFSGQIALMMKVWAAKRRMMQMEQKIAELKIRGESTKALEEALAEIGKSIKE